MNLQLRGEFFNVLNHPNFNVFSMSTDVSDPVFGINDLGVVNSTPDVGVANPLIGSGGSRRIQLGAKLVCEGTTIIRRLCCRNQPRHPSAPEDAGSGIFPQNFHRTGEEAGVEINQVLAAEPSL